MTEKNLPVIVLGVIALSALGVMGALIITGSDVSGFDALGDVVLAVVAGIAGGYVSGGSSGNPPTE